MSDTTRAVWKRFGRTTKWMVSALLGVESGDVIPRPGCLARRYAECDDFAHCRYCSPVDQALRTATWTEENWQHAQMRHRS
jgi:hypothetical protein